MVHGGNSDALLSTYRARRCWAKGSAEVEQKEFQYFICHHKQGAGAKRLLKIRLKSTAGVKRKVFIDSDDLKDLTKLQDCVANDTESLVLLHSAGVLYRPWCVLEVATATNMRLQLCRVDFPEVQQMSKETIDTYDTHVQDVTVLAEYGFDLDYVKGALRWCLAFNGIRFCDDLMQLCSEIAGSERSDNFTHRTALVMWVLQ